MIDGTDLVSLETSVRDLIGEETAKFYVQARVFRAINSEVIRLTRKIIGLDSGYFEVQYTATPTATVLLKPDCYIVRNVELLVDGAWRQPLWINDHKRGEYQAGSGADYPAAVRFLDNSLVFESGIGSASNMRICYARVPAEMRYEAMAAADATSFTLGSDASIYDDVYVGDVFATISGTGSGQYRVVSDYVGSTKVCTVTTWTSTPDTTTYVSTLLPEPLAKWPDLVAMGAAMRLLARKRDRELYAQIERDYLRDLNDMMQSLDLRQTVQSRHGNYIPDGGE